MGALVPKKDTNTDINVYPGKTGLSIAKKRGIAKCNFAKLEREVEQLKKKWGEEFVPIIDLTSDPVQVYAQASLEVDKVTRDEDQSIPDCFFVFVEPSAHEDGKFLMYFDCLKKQIEEHFGDVNLQNVTISIGKYGQYNSQRMIAGLKVK